MSFDLVCEKEIAHIGLDGYFWITETVGSNSLSVESGEAVSQAGMSLFHKRSFSFLFDAGTLKTKRGKGSNTALVAARIVCACSVGIEHVESFARTDTSAPTVSKQGFALYGEMQDWNVNWD